MSIYCTCLFQENPIGQCGLGMLYLKGHYVVKDLGKAFFYFQKSADKNWVDGQLQLGLMYFSMFVFIGFIVKELHVCDICTCVYT